MPNGFASALPCPANFRGSSAAQEAQGIRLLPYSSVNNLSVTVPTAGTPVQVSQDSILCDYVIASSDDGNTGLLCVIGNQAIRASTPIVGIPLIAANPPVGFPFADLRFLWVDARTDGDQVSITFFRY